MPEAGELPEGFTVEDLHADDLAPEGAEVEDCDGVDD